MTRIVRRSIRGTAHPHLTASPAGTSAVEIVPSPDGDLHGAACRGVNADLFFAEPDPDDLDADPAASEFATRRAKALCAGCPVRDMCLALALRRGERFGIFGGLTADERRTLKQQAARAARKAGAA